MKRHGQCRQDATCPVCGAATCADCTRRDGQTCDNHRSVDMVKRGELVLGPVS